MPASFANPNPEPDPPTDLRAIAEDVFFAWPHPAAVIDRALRVVYVNHQGAALFVQGESLADALRQRADEDRTIDWPTELRRALDGAAPQRQPGVGYRDPAGGTHLLDFLFAPLKSSDPERSIGLLLTTQDVSERSSLQKRLAVSESMAAVGRLAARVAHELNNPLDGCLRYINLSLRVLGESGDERAIRYLHEAKRGLQRMAQIVGELLEFSRGGPGGAAEGNINWVVEEALKAMRDLADQHNVILAASFHDEDMPSLPEGKLFQVFCNLLKNAIDAMPDGGCVTVATAVVDEQVVVRVSDTGVGLPGDPARIFEPFFTTKPPGQGTGLGLAICKDYIERLNGQILAENGPDKGAIFTIRIPVASCAVRTPGRSSSAGGVAGSIRRATAEEASPPPRPPVGCGPRKA